MEEIKKILDVSKLSTSKNPLASGEHPAYTMFIARCLSEALEEINPDDLYKDKPIFEKVCESLKSNNYPYEMFERWATISNRRTKEECEEAWKTTENGFISFIITAAKSKGWLPSFGDFEPNSYDGLKQASPADLPPWIYLSGRDGKKTIDEPKFFAWFTFQHGLYCINGSFCRSDGKPIEDTRIKSLINSLVSRHFSSDVSGKTNKLLNGLKDFCFYDVPKVNRYEVRMADNVAIKVDPESGRLEAFTDKSFNPNRLPVKLNLDAECPVFLRYLNDLYYEHDIPTIQEFLGYALIPCTKAQAALFIRGRGGEGKSQLGTVLMELFGEQAIQESLPKIENDRFTLANLENKLLCIGDEAPSEKLEKTEIIKTLITASIPMPIERKGKQKVNRLIYSRIINFGNTFIGTLFDNSDGFYRRQLLIECKPIPKDRIDDPMISDKMIKELSGILNWSLIGLHRLVKNGFEFTESERMKKLKERNKYDDDNVAEFMNDASWIEYDPNGCVFTKSLREAYFVWCAENADNPVKKKTFMNRVADTKGIDPAKLRRDGDQAKGYKGIKLTFFAQERIDKYSSTIAGTRALINDQ